MSSINSDEIISILKNEIENFDQISKDSEVGTVVSVGDGIANIYGIEHAMYGEIVTFENGLKGMVQDIQKDTIGCILFGDGAGAVVVERCRTESRAVEYSNALPETGKGMQETAEEKRIPPAGILGRALHSDGTGGGVLQCGARELTTPYARASAAKTDQKQQTDDREHYIQMDGQEVYRFATRRVPQCIEEALSDAGLAVPDIDMFVLHQANARIIDAVAKRLHADREKFPTNLERVGNLSSASIPVLLDELHRQGKLHRGDRIVLAGFGAGLTIGACVMTW